LCDFAILSWFLLHLPFNFHIQQSNVFVISSYNCHVDCYFFTSYFSILTPRGNLTLLGSKVEETDVDMKERQLLWLCCPTCIEEIRCSYK